jgi:hypothetical protein
VGATLTVTEVLGPEPQQFLRVRLE